MLAVYLRKLQRAGQPFGSRGKKKLSDWIRQKNKNKATNESRWKWRQETEKKTKEMDQEMRARL